MKGLVSTFDIRHQTPCVVALPKTQPSLRNNLINCGPEIAGKSGVCDNTIAFTNKHSVNM